ncbi:MAG: flagellar biosynthetic protein FliQ [Deltaproteobacteria bacterium]|nr:flagellar biosynthetic protein FliQ [Deltaproteobacteria bacterium]
MLTRPGELTQRALLLVLELSLPALLAAALIALVVGLFSATTQINDASLSHTPKLIAVSLVLALAGGSGAALMVRYTQSLWHSIPQLVRTR